MDWKTKIYLAVWACIFWVIIGFFYGIYVIHGHEADWAREWRPIVQTVAAVSLIAGPLITYLIGVIMYGAGRHDAAVNIRLMAPNEPKTTPTCSSDDTDEDEQFVTEARLKYQEAKRNLDRKWQERQKQQKPTQLPPTSLID